MLKEVLAAIPQHTRLIVETDSPTLVYEKLSDHVEYGDLHEGYVVIDDCEIHIFFKGESTGPGRIITDRDRWILL